MPVLMTPEPDTEPFNPETKLVWLLVVINVNKMLSYRRETALQRAL